MEKSKLVMGHLKWFLKTVNHWWVGTLFDINERRFLTKVHFGYRSKRQFLDFLWASKSNARGNVGAFSPQGAAKSRKLLIGTLMDQMQSVVVAKSQVGYRGKALLIRTMGHPRIQGKSKKWWVFSWNIFQKHEMINEDLHESTSVEKWVQKTGKITFIATFSIFLQLAFRCKTG